MLQAAADNGTALVTVAQVLGGGSRPNWTIRERDEALVPDKPARQSADPVSWLDFKARNGQLVISG